MPVGKLKQFAELNLKADRRLEKFIIFVIMLATIFVQSYIIKKSEAASKTLGYQDLVEGVVNFNEINLSEEGVIRLQDGKVGHWNAPDQIWNQHFWTNKSADPAMVYGPNDTIYFLPANHEGTFYKYDIERRKWEKLTPFPVELGGGAELVFDGGQKIYGICGGNRSYFYEYDIVTNQWTRLADAPVQFGGGAEIVYVGEPTPSVFAFPDQYTDRFFRYDIYSDKWEEKSSFPSVRRNDWGFEAAWDGGDFIYAISHIDREFRRYSISSDAWSDLLDDSVLGSYYRHQLFCLDSGEVIFLSVRDRYDHRNSYLRKYNPETNSWINLAKPPASNNWGYDIAGAYDGKDYIYFSLGERMRRYFFRYQISTDSWENELTLFANQVEWRTFWHGDFALDALNQKLYYTAEDDRVDFYRIMELDLNTKEHRVVFSRGDQSFWEYYRGDILYKDGYLYMIPGYLDNEHQFYRYDLSAETWEELAPLPWGVERSYSGHDLIDGGDGYLYLTRGSEKKDFARYSLADNTWEVLASSPVYFDGPGSKLAKIGNYIYASVGDRFYSGKLYRYAIDSDSWEEVAVYPQQNWTGSMTGDGQRFLYFVFDDRTDTVPSYFYRFDTQTNSWERLADLPSWSDVGEMVWDSVNQRIYYAPCYFQPYLWYWEEDETQYKTSGEWYSKTYDLVQVKSWNSLTADIGGSGSVTIYTRTSSNGKIWSNWQEVSGTEINSSPSRYLQVKVVLTGDGTATPTVANISIDYNQESDPPSNPSVFKAYDSREQKVELESGEVYEFIHPYFSWSGASDGVSGSGVKGYYVYYGDSVTADPEIEGSFQTNSDYEVNKPMTAGEVYYLRIKTVDNLGNVSSATTFFSYRYWYVSPPQSQVLTTQEDFKSGSNYNLDLSTQSGSMQLERKPDGAWSLGWAETPPENLYRGSGVYANGYIYVLGGENYTFYRFNPINGEWIRLADTPEHTGEGGALAWDEGGYIYMMPGEGKQGLYRYELSSDTWEEIAQTPADQDNASLMVYGGNNNLYFSFAGFKNFYRYSIENNSWTLLASPPDSLYYNYGGQGAWYDGDNAIYVHFGTAESYGYYNKSFARYDIKQDSWTELPRPPEYFAYNFHNLVSDGQGNLYRFGHRNQNNNPIYGLRYSIEEERWYEIGEVKASILEGFLVSDNQRFIYIFAPHTSNNNSRRFVIYDTKKNKMVPNIYDPCMLYHHGQREAEILRLARDGGMTTDGVNKIFLSLHGHLNESVNYLVEYSLTDDSYRVLTAMPYDPNDRAAIVYSRGSIYWFPGYGTQEFYRYDLHDKRWYRLADPPDVIRNVSATGMVADSQGRIYLPQGDSTVFYRFTPDGNQGSWEQLANFPNTFTRGFLLYDEENDCIYVARGAGSNNFYRYDISSNSFTILSNFPEGTSYGNGAVLNNGKIYMIKGNWSQKMFIYDISTDTWVVSTTTTPEPAESASGFVKVGDKAYAIFGNGIGYFWQFIFPDNNKGYKGRGEFTTPVYQVEGIVDYANITVRSYIPENTQIEVYTRSSADKDNWSDWQEVSEYQRYSDKIVVRPASEVRQYLQVKLVLYSYDNAYTPVINDIVFSYYFDLDPPDNPTVVSVYSDENKNSTIQSGTWNNFSQAYFEWPLPGEAGGATDGDLGSHVKGYYVYIGSDETANPLTAGEYVSENHYQPGFDSSGIYYLRIRTVDVAGNISKDTFAAFTFKLDIDPPDNPPVVTVTPSGFTSKNSFTFDWTQASDSGGSGLAAYCYRTGATEGPYSQEECTTDTILEDIEAAYKQGTNVFYLRSLDNAGNYGEGTTEVSFYYSTEAPSPVTNLEAIPASSTQNMFAFKWDLPVKFSGDSDQLVYHYSINELPGPHNTNTTTERSLAPFPAATQEGTNILYVVAEDESGNINWNNYASVTFIANTTAPGIPRNFTLDDVSDQDSERWLVVLAWDEPTFKGNGVDHYIIERSLNGHSFDRIATVANTSYVDSQIEKGVTYYYRVRASDNVGNYGGATNQIAITVRGKYNEPPAIVSEVNYEVGFNQAIIRWVTERKATAFVHYGTNPEDLNNSKGTLDLETDHIVTITGLEPDTLYYFKVQSFDQERNYDLEDTYSQTYSFLTQPVASIENVTISDITLNSAIISWHTTVPTKAKIEYGTTSNYGLFSDEESGYATEHIQKLENLNHTSTYKFIIEATTELGDKIISDEYSFSTIAYPVIRDISFQPVKDAPTTTVDVVWTTNVPTTSIVSYRLGTTTKEKSDSKMVTDHKLRLEGLADNSDYVITIKGRDAYGNMVTSEPQKWHSSLDTREPEISNVVVEQNVIGVGKTEAQLIISWRTDEPSTSQVEYNIGSEKVFDKSSLEDNQLVTEHIVVVSGMEPAQIYNIRPVSRDIAGNIAYGEPTIVSTDQPEIGILDFVLDIFEGIVNQLRVPPLLMLYHALFK